MDRLLNKTCSNKCRSSPPADLSVLYLHFSFFLLFSGLCKLPILLRRVSSVSPLLVIKRFIFEIIEITKIQFK